MLPTQTRSILPLQLPALCRWLNSGYPQLSAISRPVDTPAYWKFLFGCLTGTSSICLNVSSSFFLTLFIHLCLHIWRLLPPSRPPQTPGVPPPLIADTQPSPHPADSSSWPSLPLARSLPAAGSSVLTLVPHTDRGDSLWLLPVSSFAPLQTLPHPANRCSSLIIMKYTAKG